MVESCRWESPEEQQRAWEESSLRRRRRTRAWGNLLGRTWAHKRATARDLGNLERVTEQFERSLPGGLLAWLEQREHHQRGFGSIADELACEILGAPHDQEIAFEFWESVFPNPRVAHLADAAFVCGFAEGAVGVWKTASGRERTAGRQNEPLHGLHPTPKSVVILCVDQNDYCDALHARLRKNGGRVIKGFWETALWKLSTKPIDLAIFDVTAYRPQTEMIARLIDLMPGLKGLPGANVPQHSSPPPYQVLREITESEWGASHPVIVFSDVSHENFESERQSHGIRADRVRFYSKGRMEIPPELDGIRQRILERPSLLNIDYSPFIPQKVTHDWIDEQSSVIAGVDGYWSAQWRNSDYDEGIFDSLPRGYRMLYQYSVLSSEVMNGGFQQFFDNSLVRDESGEPIVDTLYSVRRFGLRELAMWLEYAILLGEPFLPSGVLSAVSDDVRAKSSKAGVPNLPERQIDARFRALDQRCYDADWRWEDRLDRYIKTHPEEFVSESTSEELPQ